MAGALEGKRILITRARVQAGPFVRRVHENGGIPIEVPVISFRRSDNTRFDDVLSGLSAFQWIVFTSANGVRFFFKRLQEHNESIPPGTHIAVVGKNTKLELEKQGETASVMPEAYIAGSLVDKLLDVTAAGDQVLFPCGNLAKNTVVSGLRQFGVHVTKLVVYETVMSGQYQKKLIENLREGRIDVVTFTSSSTVDCFIKLLEGTNWRELLKHVRFACIGPVTAKTLQSYDLATDIMGEPYSVDGLIQAITIFFEEEQK